MRTEQRQLIIRVHYWGIRSWEFKTFHDGVKAGTWLKPGAWECQTKKHIDQCAEVFALVP
jgi:hypothetical protein